MGLKGSRFFREGCRQGWTLGAAVAASFGVAVVPVLAVVAVALVRVVAVAGLVRASAECVARRGFDAGVVPPSAAAAVAAAGLVETVQQDQPANQTSLEE